MNKKESNRIPNLFLVGAPKCGTTALSSYLAGHPNIFMSEEAGYKEPGYYAEDEKELFGMRPIKSKDEYQKLFSSVPKNIKWVGDASVTYLASKVAVPRIVKECPDAKFIIIIRNPIEIAQGLHNQRVKESNENILNFEKSWRLQEKRLTGMCLPPATQLTPEAYQYGNMAKLGQQLKNFLSYVSWENVKIIIYDDFVADPLEIYKQTLSFLKVDYDDRTDFRKKNISQQIAFPLVLKIIIWSKSLKKILRLPSLHLGVFQMLTKISMKEGKDIITPEFERELKEYFRDDVDLLSRLIGQDLRSWVD